MSMSNRMFILMIMITMVTNIITSIATCSR